jgi:hypothetical protein
MASKAQAFQQACRLRSHTNGQQLPRTNLLQIRPKSTSTRSVSSIGTSSTVPPPHAYRQDPSQQRVLSHTRLRHASTSSPSGQNRRAITVTSDDGRYNWSELSTGEKAARSTQQTFNFLLISGGAVLTVSCHIQYPTSGLPFPVLPTRLLD